MAAMPRTDDSNEKGPDSRARMVRSAAELFRSRGLNATSFSDVLEHSGAPRGSIYHHFPNGKRQLAQVAVERTAELLLEYQRACPATDAAGIVRHFTAIWQRLVTDPSGRPGSMGCTIAGVALDTPDTPDDAPLLRAVREAFGTWTALLSGQLQAAGLSRSRATATAVMALAGMEGSLILCRAEGSSAPLETVTVELLRLVQLPE